MGPAIREFTERLYPAIKSMYEGDLIILETFDKIIKDLLN